MKKIGQGIANICTQETEVSVYVRTALLFSTVVLTKWFQSLSCLICNRPDILKMKKKGQLIMPHSHDKVLISLRLDFRRHFLTCLSNPIPLHPCQRYSGNFKLDHRCIPMHILAYADCVRSSTGYVSYIDIFCSSNLQK